MKRKNAHIQYIIQLELTSPIKSDSTPVYMFTAGLSVMLTAYLVIQVVVKVRTYSEAVIRIAYIKKITTSNWEGGGGGGGGGKRIPPLF